VRSQLVSGTHAISACLFGLLRTGDRLLSITGSPYDTLASIIGRDKKNRGTLVERGITYEEIALKEMGEPDMQAISQAISEDITMVLIQRSRGYNLRPSLDVDEIAALIKLAKEKSPDTIVMVDNCYGEFTDYREPSQCGADITAGSLIKNPGGGLAPSGGYIVGKRDLVEQVAFHITAPGLGKKLGASLLNNRLLYQGLFLAPHVVLQALKGAALLAHVFEQLGYRAFPKWNEKRGDIVQAIQLNDSQEVLNFCQIIQSSSPVDCDVRLEYAELPGYDDEIVMAAGTFVQGSSIEMSCDAPLREPYCAFIQGGLTYEHCRYVAMNLLESFALKSK
jgi:cystathionine beta-lyase family protein involved in aluminum resistance